jgi:CBS domain-containing protein
MTAVTVTAAHLLEQKGRAIFSISPEASVYDAIAEMAARRVGALLVMEGDRLEGIISERDYTRKVILHGRASRETLVKEIMASPVVTVPPNTSVPDCMALMTAHHIRHLPVMENGAPAGVLSIGDLVKAMVAAQAETISLLQGYIAGAYPA